MILVYFFIGLLTAIISAIPLGASNLAVVNTTLKQNAKQAFKIATAAGIAEVILSYYALHYNQVIKDFFNQHLWIQTLIAVILLVVGATLVYRKPTKSKLKKRKLSQSKYATGFLLGMINPPVLAYWIIAYGVLNNNNIMLSIKSSFSILFLFFLGVYLGKLLTLYGYSILSLIIKNRMHNINTVVNKVIGVLLICISFIQALNIYAT